MISYREAWKGLEEATEDDEAVTTEEDVQPHRILLQSQALLLHTGPPQTKTIVTSSGWKATESTDPTNDPSNSDQSAIRSHLRTKE